MQSIHDHVVILFPGALGDFVLALPALRGVRERHAGARVTAVVSDALRSLVMVSGVADTTASLDGAEVAWLFGGARQPPWLTPRSVVYSWLGSCAAGLAARLETVAAGVDCFAVERGPGAQHAAHAYTRALGMQTGPGALADAVRIVPPRSAAADALWTGLGTGPVGPVLAMHPGAGATAKRWGARGFAAVAAWWRRAGGIVVTITGPAESNDPPIAEGPVVRAWPLPDVAAVLARATLYLGNDSGVSHLAGAVGARGVVLFGPTDPRRWRPLGDHLVVLRARPVGPGALSLRALSVRRVVAACRRSVTLTRGDLDTSVAGAAGRNHGR